MKQTNFSPQLAKLLLIKGVCRAVLPIAVLWGLYDWCWIRPLYAVIFAILAGNYVLMYLFSWVAPHLLNGPWRIRPIQTWILLANAVLMPITYHRHFNEWPWFFIAVQLLMIAALYTATMIVFYLNARLPMSGLFQARRGGMIPQAPPPPPTDPVPPATR